MEESDKPEHNLGQRSACRNCQVGERYLLELVEAVEHGGIDPCGATEENERRDEQRDIAYLTDFAGKCMAEVKHQQNREQQYRHHCVEPHREAHNGSGFAVALGNDGSQLVFARGKDDEHFDITIEDAKQAEVVGSIDAGQQQVRQHRYSLSHHVAREKRCQRLHQLRFREVLFQAHRMSDFAIVFTYCPLRCQHHHKQRQHPP